MNYPTNTPLYKVVLDAMSRESAGTEFVIIGCDPSATGTGLQVALAVGATVSQQVGRAPAGTTLTMTAAHATLDRRDIIYETGGAFAKTDGTPASPAIPPALPAGAVLVAIVKVAANQTVLAASDVIDARQVRGGSPAMPNLVLNSDFGRRTVFGLAMPEVFADTSGYVVVSGAAPTVGSNIVTSTAANELAWCAGSFVWRDGRASGTFKAVSTTGVFVVRWRIDANNYIQVGTDGAGNIRFVKNVAGVGTPLTSAAAALTLNNWYWLEFEKQGTTVIGKIYNTGGTVPGVTKASSTLVQTITATVADASVQVGAHVAVQSDQANAQWGGIPTGNGGVYVETWLPESWAVANVGTLGGWAIGFDESADAGPVGKQCAVRTYIPATDRRFQLTLNTPDGSLAPSVAYTFSMYMKSSGATGTLIGANAFLTNSALTSQQSGLVTDLQSASWTRQTVTMTGAAGVRRAQIVLDINGAAGSKTGTAYFMLPQLEQGSAATAWRPSPDDSGGGTWTFDKTTGGSTTSAVAVEIDSRDLAANIFLPKDSTVLVSAFLQLRGSATQVSQVWVGVDGVNTQVIYYLEPTGASYGLKSFTYTVKLAAGKHRIALLYATSAGTLNCDNNPDSRMSITAMAGK